MENKNCLNCRHWRKDGSYSHCEYILHTGKRRGCSVLEYEFYKINKAEGESMDNEKVMELYNRGSNDREIAEIIGVATRTVCSWRKTRNFSPNGQKVGSKKVTQTPQYTPPPMPQIRPAAEPLPVENDLEIKTTIQAPVTKVNVIEELLEHCRAILKAKAEEYATNADRLHNFRVASSLQNMPLKKVLYGMMAKHVISIADMCMSEKEYPQELWIEKITDNINYLLLLRLAVEEAES